MREICYWKRSTGKKRCAGAGQDGKEKKSRLTKKKTRGQPGPPGSTEMGKKKGKRYGHFSRKKKGPRPALSAGPPLPPGEVNPGPSQGGKVSFVGEKTGPAEQRRKDWPKKPRERRRRCQEHPFRHRPHHHKRHSHNNSHWAQRAFTVGKGSGKWHGSTTRHLPNRSSEKGGEA